MSDCVNAPAGLLPYGYHIVDFAERFANAGAEASVTYIGPSGSRFAFLGEIFGYWMAANDPVTNECCVCLNKEPCAYPYIMNAHASGHFGEYSCNFGDGYDCLWPDTFTIQRESSTAIPMKLNCTDEDIDECNKPLYYGSLDSSDNPCECYCEITINYRHKNHACWPRMFQPCEKCNDVKCVWRPPTIPRGTFIDVRMDGFVSARLIKGDALEYITDSRYPTHPPEYEPCEQFWGTPDPRVRFDWCATPTADQLKVADELYPSRLIQTTNLEVTWSNVPMYNKKVIDRLQGCVNDTVFLGYPSEAVLFLSCDPVIRGVWGCNEVYDLTFKFAIQTVPITCPSIEDDEINGHFDEEDLLAAGVYNQQLGLWNRMWCDVAQYLEVGGKKYCCTNWAPIRLSRETCCDDDTGDGTPNTRVYEMACLDDLFSFNECSLCYDDCPETWPSCAFSG